MNKSKNKVLFEIVLFITFLVFIGSIILSKPIGDMDEIWNYNFANCVSKGLIPYKDFSMVQTPFLPILSGLFLNIFTNSLFTMRILAIILCSSIIFLVYKILEKLKVNKNINLLSVIAILILLKDYYCIDYNFFAVFLTLFIIYFELILDMNKKRNNILIGIIASLTFLTKQTIGVFVCISIILYQFIFNKYNKTKSINVLYRILGGMIPGILFVIYLIATNSFNSFIDYAILGITTFSNKISYSYLLQSKSITILLLALYIPINFIIMTIYSIKNKNKNIFIILLLSLSAFAIAFPISDKIHFLIGSIPSFIAIVYFIDKLLKKMFKEKLAFIKFFVKAFSYLIILYILVFGIVYYIYMTKTMHYCNLNHFKNIPISEELENDIIKIEDYIKNSNKNVYILNFTAANYMIPLDIYNKNFDMLMQGNFGSKGEDGLIHDIDKMNDVIFLVLNKEYPKNWQHPIKVTDYIENNFKHIDSIGKYEVYIK